MAYYDLRFLIVLSFLASRCISLETQTAQQQQQLSNSPPVQTTGPSAAVANNTASIPSDSRELTINANKSDNENASRANASENSSYIHNKLSDNGAVIRAFYVILSVTGIVVVYFVIRAVRLRRKRSKSRKYGIIAKSGDLEMTPLDQGDDDEDTTVFEASNHIRK